MVVKEFVPWRITPLQRHSRPMWTFTGPKDPIRLQVPSIHSKMLRAMLVLLKGDPAPAVLPEDGCLLWHCSNKEDFVKQMPSLMSRGYARGALKGLARIPSSWLPCYLILRCMPQVC